MRHHLHRVIGLAAVLVALVAAARLVTPGVAGADVVRQQGFFATVLGWTSWYGSYGMGDLGRAWCIDHGSRAPDPGFAYAPVDVADHTTATKTAMAWIVGRYGPDVDDRGAAAVMLALHDLAGAHYPYGSLDVDGMTTRSLAGFAGNEATILEHARAYKADGLAHAHLAGSYRLSIAASAATPAGESTVTVRLTDGAGSPLGGETATLIGDEVAFPNGTTRTTLTTAADGTAVVSATLGAPTGRIDASVELPDLDLQAFGSTTTAAQRVVRPARVTATASVQIDRPPPGSITIRKIGDDEPYLPVVGARFTIIGPAGSPIGEVAAAADGRTPAVTVEAGHYGVVEAQPPPGYVAAGPWELDVAAGQDVTLEVANAAIRGRVSIHKVDSVTGEPIAGARLQLAFDADHDGDDYEVEFEPVTTSTDALTHDNLLPGRYQLREVETPAGYASLGQPLRFDVRPGATTPIQVTNRPQATVAFWKVAPDDDGPLPSRAGATFEVTSAGGAMIGACTTDGDGKCSLAGLPLEGGARHCWREVVAPPGWGLAEPGCFDAGPAGSTTTVRVLEPLAPSPSPTPAPPPAPTLAPEPIPGPVPAAPLPRTGAATVPVAAIGAGLVLVGGALMCLRAPAR